MTRYEQKMYLDIDKIARATVRIADALEDLLELEKKKERRLADQANRETQTPVTP